MWATLEDIWQNFNILTAILDFEVFSNANCYETDLIQHYISNIAIVDMTKTMKQQGISL